MRVKITLRCNECKQRNYNTMKNKKNSPDHGKWFREMRSELKKVVWPDGKTTAKNTGTVLLCSVAVGACIWIFDGVAVLLIKTLIGAFTG